MKFNFPFAWYNKFGSIPSTYKEAMSYEEQILWLCKHQDDLEKAFIEFQEVVSGLQDDVAILDSKVDGFDDRISQNTTDIGTINTQIENGLPFKYLESDIVFDSVTPDLSVLTPNKYYFTGLYEVKTTIGVEPPVEYDVLIPSNTLFYYDNSPEAYFRIITDISNVDVVERNIIGDSNTSSWIKTNLTMSNEITASSTYQEIASAKAVYEALQSFTPISSYNALDDKPQINSVTLQGNKTLSDLRIASIDDYNYLYGLQPYKRAVGTTIRNISNAINGKLRYIQLVGNYYQDENPSTASPKDIEVVTGSYRFRNKNAWTGATTTIEKYVDLKDIRLMTIPMEDDVDYIYPVFMIGGVVNWYLHKATGYIASYNGETITTSYVSTTGGLDTGAEVYYQLDSSNDEEITDTDIINDLNGLLDFESFETDCVIVVDDFGTGQFYPYIEIEYYVKTQEKLTSANGRNRNRNQQWCNISNSKITCTN